MEPLRTGLPSGVSQALQVLREEDELSDRLWKHGQRRCVIDRRFSITIHSPSMCYDIESAVRRNRVRLSLTKEGVVRFLKKREPNHFVVARGGKALWTGREFLHKFGEQSTSDR